MVAGTLYTYPGYYRGFKAQIAASFSGFDLKTVELERNDKRAQVPAFESEKANLFDANAIAYYVSNDQMRGTTNEDKATVLQWLNYGGETVSHAVAAWVYPSLSLVESCQPGIEKAKNDLRQVFARVNDYLKTRTFLAGERMTLADVSLACDLLLAFKHVADEKFRKPFGNLNRWFSTVVNQDKVKKVLGEVKLCVEAQEFCADKFAKHKEAAAPPKVEKKAKEPKAPKAKKVVEEVEEKDEAEELMAAEPKSNDPFATMEKGTFNMDEFKRTYSNEDIGKVALPYFWKNFEENKQYYSIWKCEYQYPEDLSMVFMTCNLIGGMFQRIEKLRKNSFSCMNVYGVNNKNTIAGVWFWKGQDLVFPLNTDWTTDYESYSWTKMDSSNPADRKFLEECWNDEGVINGDMKYNQGKTFK